MRFGLGVMAIHPDGHTADDPNQKKGLASPPLNRVSRFWKKDVYKMRYAL
jgi:hypothetical protein